MARYIELDALVAEIEKRKHKLLDHIICESDKEWVVRTAHQLNRILLFLDTLEVKEVDLDVMQRMEECPYRRVGCTMYEDKILDCNGACSWVVDYPKLKELKAQKGEKKYEV